MKTSRCGIDYRAVVALYCFHYTVQYTVGYCIILQPPAITVAAHFMTCRYGWLSRRRLVSFCWSTAHSSSLSPLSSTYRIFTANLLWQVLTRLCEQSDLACAVDHSSRSSQPVHRLGRPFNRCTYNIMASFQTGWKCKYQFSFPLASRRPSWSLRLAIFTGISGRYS